MTNNKLLYISLIILCLSCNNDEHKSIAEKIKDQEITVLGNPDSLIFDKYLSNNSSFRYIVNSMMTIDVIAQDTGAYHCFIMENVDNQQQLSYLMLDDVIKYNYIPYYDSLEYDLNLTFEQTEFDSLKWSSKFEEIPYLRLKSTEYQQLVSTCNDIQDLSNFCNNSLYFKKKCHHYDERVLTKLIEITQAQLVGTYLRGRARTHQIILGWISSQSYMILKFKNMYRDNRFYVLNDGIRDYYFYFENWINELNHRQSRNYKKREIERKNIGNIKFQNELERKHYLSYSKYLLKIQDKNLKFINNNIKDISITQQDSCDILMCIDYKYSDSRIFLFNIDRDTNNNITITKNYYNKEFLPTTRMSNYYLYY